jgi:hypothetical protein
MFVWGLDPIAPQKAKACRALLAQEWFTFQYPRYAPLPVHCLEINEHGWGVPHMLAYYALSLRNLDYAVHIHPSFEDYARGVLALPSGDLFLPQLKEIFPPRPLVGIRPDSLMWLTPERYAREAVFWEHLKVRADR